MSKLDCQADVIVICSTGIVMATLHFYLWLSCQYSTCSCEITWLLFFLQPLFAL